MQQALRKIAAFCMALFLLGSTSSFTISKHYCGEHLVDVAFFGDAEACAMEAMLDTKYGPDHTKKMDCCQDEQIVLEGQDELKISFETLDFDTAVFLSAFTYSYSNLFQALGEHFVPFDGYPPPLITQDFHTLYEQYLI